jgi:hypothetical protein
MMTQPVYGSPSDPMEPDIDQNGVDRSQIRQMLDLTPAQRLLVVQNFADWIAAVRRLNGTSTVR